MIIFFDPEAIPEIAWNASYGENEEFGDTKAFGIATSNNDTVYVVGFLLLLFVYTGILIARILYARKMWHSEFGKGDLGRDPSVNKMGDLIEKLDKVE